MIFFSTDKLETQIYSPLQSRLSSIKILIYEYSLIYGFEISHTLKTRIFKTLKSKVSKCVRN